MHSSLASACRTSSSVRCFSFFFQSYGSHRDLHSFPTRRSSDLKLEILFAKIDSFEYSQEVARHLGVLPAIAVGLIRDRKSTRLNSSHRCISYAVFCLKKKKKKINTSMKRTYS